MGMPLSEPKIKILTKCLKKEARWAELKNTLSITDKALNAHLKKLVGSGYLQKSEGGYRTTPLGLRVIGLFSTPHEEYQKMIETDLARAGRLLKKRTARPEEYKAAIRRLGFHVLSLMMLRGFLVRQLDGVFNSWSAGRGAPQNREKNAEPGARRSKMSPEERKIQLEKIRLMRETLGCLKRIEGRLKNWG
jgi:hypothetical protein